MERQNKTEGYREREREEIGSEKLKEILRGRDIEPKPNVSKSHRNKRESKIERRRRKNENEITRKKKHTCKGFCFQDWRMFTRLKVQSNTNSH